MREPDRLRDVDVVGQRRVEAGDRVEVVVRGAVGRGRRDRVGDVGHRERAGAGDLLEVAGRELEVVLDLGAGDLHRRAACCRRCRARPRRAPSPARPGTTRRPVERRGDRQHRQRRVGAGQPGLDRVGLDVTGRSR